MYKNEYVSDFAIGYIPSSFVNAIGIDTFSNASSNITNKISYAWLVRSFRLFEAVSDWLRVKRFGDYSTTVLMDTWARSKEIRNMPFSASTGRMTDSTSLAFVKLINKGITDAQVRQLYIDISKTLKAWDIWYLNHWSNWVQTVASNVTGLTRSESQAFLVDVNYLYFVYGVSDDDRVKATKLNSSLTDKPVVINGIECYEVYTLRSAAKSFEDSRIDPNSETSTEDYKSDYQGSLDDEVVVISGALDLETMIKMRKLKEQGKQVLIRGLGSVEGVLKKTSLTDDEKAETVISNTSSKFPILDFVGGRTAENTDGQ